MKRKVSIHPKRRSNINTKICAAPNLEEKQLVALTGGIRPKTDAQGIVLGWLSAKQIDDFGNNLPIEKRTAYREWIERSTFDYIRRAMTEWKPELLRELAKEMKQLGRKWAMDTMGWFLHEASKLGPVNVSQLARELKANGTLSASLRTWQDRALKLKIKTVRPGRPPK